MTSRSTNLSLCSCSFVGTGTGLNVTRNLINRPLIGRRVGHAHPYAPLSPCKEKSTSLGFNSPVTSEPTFVATLFFIVYFIGIRGTKPCPACSVDFVNQWWPIPGRTTQKITKYNFSPTFYQILTKIRHPPRIPPEAES
jgi:hypothetical protein